MPDYNLTLKTCKGKISACDKKTDFDTRPVMAEDQDRGTCSL